MRARRGGIFRLEQWDPTLDRSLFQVEFRHSRTVPKTAPSATAVAGGDHSVGKRRWNHFVRAHVELFQDEAADGVDENDVVGKIICDQQPIGRSLTRDDRQPSGIWDRGSLGGLMQALSDFLAWSNLLGRKFYETIPSNFTSAKAIHRNPVSGVARLFTVRISDRADGSIYMLAI